MPRARYEEANFKRLEPPSKKKKGDGEKKRDEDDGGWETGGAKKKTAGKKAPAPMTFPGFSPKVAEMLSQCHEAGVVSKGELDERVMEDLKALPERGTSLAAHVKAAHASFSSASSPPPLRLLSASSPPPPHPLLLRGLPLPGRRWRRVLLFLLLIIPGAPHTGSGDSADVMVG